MHTRRLLTSLLVIMAVSLALPEPATAGPELTFVLGAMIGDSLTDVLQVRPSTITTGFKNAPIYGGRLGWSAFPFAVEGSLVVSNSAINIEPAGSIDARLIYAEAELQILLFPGPVSPFLAGGLGLHNIRLETGSRPSETVIGYIIGGGLKVRLGSVGVRADLRDHISRLDLTKLDDAFVAALGIAESTTAHNVELSAGVTISF